MINASLSHYFFPYMKSNRISLPYAKSERPLPLDYTFTSENFVAHEFVDTVIESLTLSGSQHCAWIKDSYGDS